MAIVIRIAPATTTISDTITAAQMFRMVRRRKSRHVGAYGTRKRERL